MSELSNIKLPYIVKLWKTGKYNDHLIYYPYFVHWYLKHYGVIKGKWSRGWNDEGWTTSMLCEPVIEGWMCMVVHWTYPYKGGMRSPTKEEIEMAIKDGRVIDMSPNEPRLREYEVYKWWTEKYNELVEKVEAKVNELLDVLKL